MIIGQQRGRCRTLALPRRGVVALRGHYDGTPAAACQADAFVCTRSNGDPLDRHTALREFRKVVRAAGLQPSEWVPRDMRHSFVALLSDDGMPAQARPGASRTNRPHYRRNSRPQRLRHRRRPACCLRHTPAHAAPGHYRKASRATWQAFFRRAIIDSLVCDLTPGRCSETTVACTSGVSEARRMIYVRGGAHSPAGTGTSVSPSAVCRSALQASARPGSATRRTSAIGSSDRTAAQLFVIVCTSAQRAGS